MSAKTMAIDLRPGNRIHYAGGEGIVTIVRHSRNAVLIFFPASRVSRWIDMKDVTRDPTNKR
jgi:hypothetical protein